ncbi:MAG TPA: hypothetical protein VMI31_01080 [Fimbriimonadaceae bacterium]|nr:hypothetical protein [Fimbriimonadaceae bacterium]
MAFPFLAAALLSVPAQRVLINEAFDRPDLDGAWHRSLSSGNDILVENGALKIVAFRNTYANISRKIGADDVTAQCRIKPAPAESWATSIFLYWDAGDWCQLGIKSIDGGRYYMTQMTNGVYTEYNLGMTPFDAWHYVRIELGRDVLRFYSSDNASKWKLESFTERPPSFDGPPTALVLGKGFGGEDGYPKPMLANDYSDKGEMGTSLIDDVLVTPTPSAKLKATASEHARWAYALEDHLGKEMLARPGGPTFAAIAKRLPGIERPREVVGVPEHPYDIGVGWDGTIQLKDWLGDEKMPAAFFEVGDPAVRVGSPECPVTKRLVPGGIPVVVMSFDHAGVHFVARVFGWSPGMSPDMPLSAYVAVAATTQSASPTPFKLRLNMSPAPDGYQPLEWSGEIEKGRPMRCSARSDRSAKWSGFTEVTADEAAARMGEYEEAWEKRLDTGMQIETPETRVNDSYHAWMAYNLLNVDKKGPIYEIHDGSGFYEEIYAYSAFLFCNALDMYGHPKEAEKYIDSLLTFQQPKGLLTINYGLPDMGTMLFTMSQHHRFTGDDAWLKRVAPRMIKACDWLIAERRIACKQPKNSVTYGLIKFKPYCDYPGAAFDYYSDAYCVVGMEAAARELRSIGLAKDAARIAKEAETYRRDVLASMDRAKIERDGLAILPMEPDTHRLLKRSQYRGGEYYGLVAPCLLETEFLTPEDRRTLWVTDFMEQRGGFVCGMSQFADGVDHAYTYGYWLTCLRQGRPDRAVLGLYGSMAGAISRDTFAGVEVMHVYSGIPEGTLPHTYSGTQQLRLLRMMLLREEGNDLQIGQAIPRGWMADGKALRLRHAPTLFGPVDVSYRSNARSGMIEAVITPAFREKPATIHLWFRHPDGKPIKSVTVNGRLYPSFSGEAVILRNLSRPARIVASF